MKSQELAKAKLPDVPGVYFFRKGKDILYIGKATSLRDRTKSYFAKDLIATRGPLIVDMVFKADTVKWQETDSVLEALILEANLIKQHQPYYNTKEKDDKSWNYVVITKDDLPKVLVIRGKDLFSKHQTPKTIQLSSVLLQADYSSKKRSRLCARFFRLWMRVQPSATIMNFIVN